MAQPSPRLLDQPASPELAEYDGRLDECKSLMLEPADGAHNNSRVGGRRRLCRVWPRPNLSLVGVDGLARKWVNNV